MFPWGIFFWKYTFEIYCFCLCGTIFHRDHSFGVRRGGKRVLNDLRPYTSGHYGTLGKTGRRNWGFDTNV